MHVHIRRFLSHRTMSVYESGTSTFNALNSQLQTQPRMQMQTYMQETAAEENAPIGRQNSFLSLTLDEIQMKSGKNFGGMNMDEFLANLWTTVEEDDNKGVVGTHHDGEKPTVLPRQGSLSVPVPLCKKTVDEVWLEIQNGVKQQQQRPSGQNSNEDNRRQRTLGEITLEDFLVKAGVVQEPLKGKMRMASSDFGYNTDFGVGFHCQNQINYCDNRMVYTESRPVYSVLGESSSCTIGNERSNQYFTGLDSFRTKKRIIDGPHEIVMERRQRRMIKNRESAARSRARRQAYTAELELELNNLTEENTKLKKIVEENEKKRRQEVMNRSTQITKDKSGDKVKRLRRIASAEL